MNTNRKSNTYQRLQEALAEEGCPICYLGHQAGLNHLDNLLYEFVNDPRARKTLTQSMGFCGRHSHKLLTYSGHRMGVAMIQQDLLQEALKRLPQQQTQAPRSFWRQFEAELRSNAEPGEIDPTAAPLSDQACPACQSERELEKRALKELLTNLIDDLDEPLQAAGGLCWPHLQQALWQISDPEVRSRLTKLQAQIWQEVITDLGEFIRKSDYRFRGETVTNAEKTAAARAIGLLTGTSFD